MAKLTKSEIVDLLKVALYGIVPIVEDIGPAGETRKHAFNSAMQNTTNGPQVSQEGAPVVRSDWVHSPKILRKVIPDQVYKPEVRIAIDFAHAVRAEKEGEPAVRVVSEAVLQRFVKNSYNFVMRYFNTIFASGTGAADIAAVLREKPPTDSDEIILFINDVINYFLTTVSIERSVNSIGVASFKLKGIKNTQSTRGNFRLFFDSMWTILDQLFVPMLPVRIWAKGRLYPDWWFSIYDGYIITTSTSDEQGYVEYTITCRDVLEFARFTVEMTHPGLNPVGEKKERKRSYFQILKKQWYNYDHFSIISLLAAGSDSLLYAPDVPEGFVGTPEAEARDRKFKSMFPAESLADFTPESIISGDFSNPNIDGLTRAYQHIAIHKDDFGRNKRLEQVRHVFTASSKHAGTQRNIIFWGHKITPYRVFQFVSPQFFDSTFSNRLDMMLDVAKRSYFNIYIDGSGNLQYHPMRLNNEFLSVAAMGGKNFNDNAIMRAFPYAQVIGQEEIINTASVFNSENLITYYIISGALAVPSKGAGSKQVGLYGTAEIKFLSDKFGYRRFEEENPLFNKQVIIDGIKFLDMYAAIRLAFLNAELYTRSTELVFRPELELASPVLYPHEGQVFYVTNITHNITIGGAATTSINTNMGRLDRQPPPDFMSFLYGSELIKEGMDSDDLSAIFSSVLAQLEKYYSIMQSDLVTQVDLSNAINDNSNLA